MSLENKLLPQFEKKKVFVAIPTLSDVDMSTVKCLWNLLGYSLTQKLHMKIEIIASSLLPESRRVIARMAVEQGYDYILFIDADMKFPHDLLVRLLNHDVDVISTNYVTKSETDSRCTSVDLEGRRIYTTSEKSGIQEIALTATGTMLIKTEVFKKLPNPWFFLIYEEETDRIFGEDYYFCHKARAHGFKIYIDHDLTREVFHIGRKEYSIEHALKCFELNGTDGKDRIESDNSEAEGSKRGN